MPLPSQGARPLARRSHMYRRARKPRALRRVFKVGIPIGLIAAGWALWPEGGLAALFDSRPDEADLVAGVTGRIDDASSSGDARLDEAEAPGAARAADDPLRRLGLDEGARRAEDDEQTTNWEMATGDDPTADEPARGLVMGAPTLAVPEPEVATPSAPAPAAEPASAPDSALASSHDGTTSPVTRATERERSVPEAAGAPSSSGSGSGSTPAAGRGDRTTSYASQRMEAGFDLINRNRPLDGRRVLSDLLLRGTLTEAQASVVRDRLTALNEDLIFSPHVDPDDRFVLTYEVQSGDSLSKIAQRLGLQTEWTFIQRVNRISNPRSIQVGQTLKLITGPFHAVVSKRAYRMDLYMGDAQDLVYVCSFPVGLGRNDRTPVARFVVKKDSKLVNPEWINPETRQRYAPDDPANPIGERWIGLECDDPQYAGFGIHGTIEPDSIGRQASMGCIRMRSGEVEIAYETLMPVVSRVEIVE